MSKCRSIFQGSAPLRRNFVSVAKKKELNDVLLLVPRKPFRLAPRRLMATEYVGGIGKYGNVLVIGGILGFVGVSAYLYKNDLITLGLPPDQNSVPKLLTTDRFSTQSELPGPSGVQPLTSTPTQGSSSLALSASKKRKNCLPWDEYFMAVAVLSAQRSKDPVSQVGACIVNQEKKIVGTGYNGMPNRCDDDKLPWGKEGALVDKKHPYVCHAEMNAIMNKNSSDVKDCTIYVALFPCNECAKLIIQSGIRKIFYLSDKHHEKPETIASKKMLDMADVKYEKYIPKQDKIEIDFFAIDPDSRPGKSHHRKEK